MLKKINAILCFSALSVFALSAQDKITVKGTVTDNDGEPLPSAVISLSGGKQATVANTEGQYSISDIPVDGTLVFSFLGFEQKNIKVNGRSEINCELRMSTNELNDAVVIGYGVAKKKDLTGSVVSLRGDVLTDKSPTDVYDMLQGQAAGVQITSTSGAPGEGATVRIRGIATFGEGANPLYVVDDMPVDDISNINPDDIVSIEVLKDAASAAIYGSRSANGVILISTKQGIPGKPRFDVSYNHGLANVAHLIPLTTPDDFRYYEDVRYALTGNSQYHRDDETAPFMNSDGNLYDQVLRTAHKNELNFSMSGATDRLQYFLSAGYYGEQGVVINTDYNRYTMRVNAQYQVSKKFTIGNRTQLSFSDRAGVDEGGIMAGFYGWCPYWSTTLVDGSTTKSIAGLSSVYARASEEVLNEQKFTANTLLFAEFRFTNFLKLRCNLSGNANLLKIWWFKPSSLINSSTGHTQGYDRTKLTYYWLNEDYLSYDRSINGHNVGAMLGMSFTGYTTEENRVYGLDYTTDKIYTVNAATQFLAGDNFSTINKHTMASFYGRVTYNWQSRYLVEANLRYDGSSRFSNKNKWGLFPSASLGWRLSEEPFMDWSKPVLSDFKFRGSYGVTGNENIGDYTSWAKYDSNGVYGGVGGLYPSLTYSDLSWEKTTQWDAGIDMAFANNRVNIVADYYWKNTNRLLYDVQVPKEIGYNTLTKNVGAVSNNGIEVTLNANIIDTRDVKWKLSFNISHNTAKATKLADDVPFYVGKDNCIYMQTGSRLGEFYGLKHDGIFTYDESNAFDSNWNQLTPVFNEGVFSHYTLNGEAYSGDVLQKTMNGTVLRGGDANWVEPESSRDGKIDSKDFTVLGCAQADFFGGLTTTISYKWFSLFLAFDYSIGGDIYNAVSRVRNDFNNDHNAPDAEHIYNMWTTPGDISKYPTPDRTHVQNTSYPVNDFWIEDGSFVRLRTAKLFFRTPKKWRDKLKLAELTINIYGRNLLTWTNYSGNDPEFGAANVLSFGIDTGRYPRKREFGFGINIGF